MPPRSPFPLLATPSDARTATLQGLLIAAIVIAGLYVGREVLLPLALAILLSFVLTPPLLLLRRIKIPRVLAVGIVVFCAFAIIFALGWLMSREATQLASDLPRYQNVLSEKIRVLHESTAQSTVLQKAEEVLSNLQEQLTADDTPPPAPEVGTPAEKPEDQPVKVEIYVPEPTGFQLYQRIAGTLLPPLATAGIVLLFVVFILLQREDLRDRLIRLFAASDLQRATTTMTDAATRLSRYFLRQVLINAGYGTFITFALWLIGIPSPLVWGVIAMLMRFVPFVGGFIAAAFPLVLAAVVDTDWTTFLMVGALFLASELIMGQVIEPLVFGRGTGLSPIAVIAATIFWTWLWGPLGLILAMPITVCLAVLGRHVEGLQFFEVLLGDKPALTPEESFYRRTLSGDAAEATYQAELSLKDQSLESYLDTVALGALKLAERDSSRGVLDEEQSEGIAATVNEMLDNLADFAPRRWFGRLRERLERHDKADDEGQDGLAALDAAEAEDEGEAGLVVDRAELAPGWAVEEPIRCIGGRTVLDEAAAAMLAELLKKHGLGANTLGPEAISAAHITSLATTPAKLLCLSYLGMGGGGIGMGTGQAHIRYLVRRLRRILPAGTLILVCYWADEPDGPTVKTLMETAEADAYATSLPEAVRVCIEAAKGELKSATAKPDEADVDEAEVEEAAEAALRAEEVAPAVEPKPQRPKRRSATPRKPQTASA